MKWQTWNVKFDNFPAMRVIWIALKIVTIFHIFNELLFDVIAGLIETVFVKGIHFTDCKALFVVSIFTAIENKYYNIFIFAQDI